MKTLNREQLREYVPYSDTHLRRLEAAGKFPKRIKIGDHRVVWLKDEVIKWLEDRASESRVVGNMCVDFPMKKRMSWTRKLKEAWLYQ